MEIEEIINELKSLSSPEDLEGRARFGIKSKKAFGVRIPELRKIAKKLAKII